MEINVKEIGNNFKKHWVSELTKLTKEYASVCEKPSRFFNDEYGYEVNLLFQTFYPDVKNYNRWMKHYPKPGNFSKMNRAIENKKIQKLYLFNDENEVKSVLEQIQLDIVDYIKSKKDFSDDNKLTIIKLKLIDIDYDFKS